MTTHGRHGVLNHWQLDFCSRILFWIYSDQHVTLAHHSKSQNPHEVLFDAEVWKYNNQYVAIVVVDVLSVCMVSWHENIFRIAGPFWWESTGHQILLTTRNAKLEYFFVVSLGKVLNLIQETRCRWFTGDTNLLLWFRIGFYSYSRYH